MKYALVAVYRLQDAEVLYFVRWLKKRNWQDVSQAVQNIIAEISSMAGERFSVVRLRSDKGRELITEKLAAEVEALGIFKTTTAGYNPQPNGQAERAIGFLKTAATGFLIKGRLSAEYWPYAMIEAARRQREGVLGTRYQGKLPQPGETVAISLPLPEPFEPKAESGRFLARNDMVSGGAYVEVERNGKKVIIATRLPAVLDREEQTWTTHTTPSGDMVWVSSRGEVRDAEHVRDLGVDLGLLTLEERAHGPDTEDSIPFATVCNALAEDLEGDPCVETATYEEPEGLNPKEPSGDVRWDKYHILSWEEEQDANRIEHELIEASIAPAQAETVDLKGFYEGPRKEAWYNSLVKEYSKMQKGVLEETLRTEVRDRLGLPADACLPREIPSKIVPTLKPAEEDQQATANEDGYVERSRLCACGNFENGADNSGEPWTSSNIPPEIVRCMVSMTVKEKAWTLGGFDVEAAFLNAEISSGDPVLNTPPKVMRDLGIVGKDTIWIARRNIYGLRRGPTEWERERDAKCNNAELLEKAGDHFGRLKLIPLDLSAGLWKVVEGDRTVGIACCYVDDGLVAGPTEVIRRVIAFFKSQWKIKPTGFLKRSSELEQLEIDQEMKLKQIPCMRFLGTELFVDGQGISLTQRKYIAQELRMRGWLHLKGSESLPTPREGQLPVKEHGTDWERNNQLAQKECGVLMWIALRSRPDICACLGIAATQVATHPSEALKLTKGIWRYLRATWDTSVHYKHDRKILGCCASYPMHHWLQVELEAVLVWLCFLEAIWWDGSPNDRHWLPGRQPRPSWMRLLWLSRTGSSCSRRWKALWVRS